MERAGVEDSSPEVEAVYGLVVAVGLGSGRRCGDRVVKGGTALREFSGALRHAPPNVFRRHPCFRTGAAARAACQLSFIFELN